MERLCRDCPNCKSAKTGAVSNRYWCGLTGDGYNGKAMGVYPWKNKPHPKCPMKGKSREDGELHPTMQERRGKDEGKPAGRERIPLCSSGGSGAFSNVKAG